MDDTWDKMGLELLLRLKYVGCRDQYKTRLSFYKPLCYSTIRSEIIFPLEPHFITSFLTLQRCKVTILHLLDHELYCLKLTRDYVTTLINYKGRVTTTTVG